MKKKQPAIRLDMPIKPYLLKFVRYIENLPDGEPLDLSQRGVTAATLKRMLSWKNEATPGEMFKGGYDAVLPVIIPPRNWQRGNWYINARAIKDFNDALNHLFHEMLNFKIMADVADGLEQKQSIEGFMLMLDIFEDIEYDTIKKANQRLRTDRNIILFERGKMSLSPTNVSSRF